MARVWRSNSPDDGSIHSMGNGRIIAYGCGPNIAFMYGPPYSSTSVMALSTEYNGEAVDKAVREPGTAIWNHKTEIGGEVAVEFSEFVAAGIPVYMRLVNCRSAGVKWTIKPSEHGGFSRSAGISETWQQSIRPGQPIFGYPSNLWAYHWVTVAGACKSELNESGELVITFAPGKSSVTIVGAVNYSDGVKTAEKVHRDGPETLLELTRRHWKDFTTRRYTARPELSSLPESDKYLLDGAAVLLKCQQSIEGGEMAGPVFPLAYVRDQYGVARGMLSLGMHVEAKQNLLFRYKKFQRFGDLRTAEAMGTDCVRHTHENDEVEGPSYTILQARDYVKSTGDKAFTKKLWPMLKWCWQVQEKHMAGGLLPFNGDETYVAGHFYPRSGLLQGSADTTLAYIEAGKWLAGFAVEQKLWTKEHADEQLKHVLQARGAYRRFFLRKDRIWANAPEREELAEAPRFRHGVCEGRCGWFGWTERNKNGRYVCPKCLADKDLQPERPERMEVNSVGLLPAYLGSDVITKTERKFLMDHVLTQKVGTGHIPSVPGTTGCVGYDPGLILLNLTAIDHPAAKAAYERTVGILDRAGAWNEYYEASDTPRPSCCRCRPWETGINAEAVVEYLLGKDRG